jgi:hypothetical protein
MKSARKPKAKHAKSSDRPDPGEEEEGAMLAALVAQSARKAPVELTWGDGATPQVTSPHTNDTGFKARLFEAFGTGSYNSVNASINQLDAVARSYGTKVGESEVGVNAALALMASIGPRDELEAALALQMTGCHMLGMEMLARAKQADRTDHLELYGNLAVKFTRTFTLQMEALAKLRGGGQQKVEVRHVHVNGSAVIGDVHTARGGGGAATENRNQPHTQGLGYSPGAPVPEMWGADAARDALPVAGGVGTETVQDARGNVARGREGRG